jgi:hypothetical protein
MHLPECYSAWGPNTDRHHKSLIDLPSVESMLGADSHAACVERLNEEEQKKCRAIYAGAGPTENIG